MFLRKNLANIFPGSSLCVSRDVSKKEVRSMELRAFALREQGCFYYHNNELPNCSVRSA